MTSFHRALLALLIFANPALAEGDVFQSLSGTYGPLFSPTLSCKLNPHRISFYDNNQRARFDWQAEIVGYNEKRLKTAEYTVVGTSALGIILALDGESRLTDAGEPVVWILRPVQGLAGYCWGRTDWPELRCIATHIRCEDAAPTS